MRAVRWPALMDRAAAAEYLSISERNLARLVAGKEIPTRKVGVKSIRFSRDELDAWIAGLPSGQSSQEKDARRPKVGAA